MKALKTARNYDASPGPQGSKDGVVVSKPRRKAMPFIPESEIRSRDRNMNSKPPELPVDRSNESGVGPRHPLPPRYRQSLWPHRVHQALPCRSRFARRATASGSLPMERCVRVYSMAVKLMSARFPRSETETHINDNNSSPRQWWIACGINLSSTPATAIGK